MGATVMELPRRVQRRLNVFWWLIAAAIVGGWLSLLVVQSDTWRGQSDGVVREHPE